jgi:hypothetical protein
MGMMPSSAPRLNYCVLPEYAAPATNAGHSMGQNGFTPSTADQMGMVFQSAVTGARTCPTPVQLDGLYNVNRPAADGGC